MTDQNLVLEIFNCGAVCERSYSDDVNVCEIDGSVLKESIWSTA